MTSKLPKIEIVKVDSVIQKTTISSMQAGLYQGFTCMIDGIIEKIANELGKKAEDINIISTGGFSSLLTTDSKYNIIIDRFLTLRGLKLIYDMNRRDTFVG